MEEMFSFIWLARSLSGSQMRSSFPFCFFTAALKASPTNRAASN